MKQVSFLSTTLSFPAGTNAATALGDYGLIGGGRNNSGDVSVVDIIDSAFTRVNTLNLSSARYAFKAASIDKYALFVGGLTMHNEFLNTVDVYQIA